jgi:hypothetical protein
MKRERATQRGSLLDCYLVAFCKGAACDGNSGDVSLFQMAMTCRHLLTDFGLASPYSVMFFLESSDTGFKAEVRALWVSRDADVPDEPIEDPSVVTVARRLMQLRKSPVRLPSAPGHYDLALDWRLPGERTWQRASGRFPVVFEERT